MRILLLAVIAASLGLAACEPPAVCFVVRTFWGQGSEEGNGYLPKMIETLRRQTNERCEVLHWASLDCVIMARPMGPRIHPDLHATCMQVGRASGCAREPAVFRAEAPAQGLQG